MGEGEQRGDGTSAVALDDEEYSVSTLVEGVAGIREAVAESSLEEKVERLRGVVDSLSREVQGLPRFLQGVDSRYLQELQQQVAEVQAEWGSLSTYMKTQFERLDSLLSSFPGVVEVSAVRALCIRLSQLEDLVSRHVEDSRAKAAATQGRKQLAISLAALGSTVVLWSVWLALSVVR